MKSLYQRVRETRDDPSTNRYAKIHVMFHELAILKLGLDIECNFGTKDYAQALLKSYDGSRNVKQFWKDFFGIKTLTELKNERLNEIENFLEKKIKYEYKRRFNI